MPGMRLTEPFQAVGEEGDFPEYDRLRQEEAQAIMAQRQLQAELEQRARAEAAMQAFRQNYYSNALGGAYRTFDDFLASMKTDLGGFARGVGQAFAGDEEVARAPVQPEMQAPLTPLQALKPRTMGAEGAGMAGFLRPNPQGMGALEQWLRGWF